MMRKQYCVFGDENKQILIPVVLCSRNDEQTWNWVVSFLDDLSNSFSLWSGIAGVLNMQFYMKHKFELWYGVGLKSPH